MAEAGGEQAPDALHAAAARSSGRARGGGPGGRAGVRVQAGPAGRGEGPDRPRAAASSRSTSPRPTRRFARRRGWSWARAYRTLLGHFRHEIGHYYWDRLIADAAPLLAAFRGCFGDERASYEDAVAAHYRDGAPPDWPARFVSSYASMHPWEDWAESWAHYLHMVDTLETARSFGLVASAAVSRRPSSRSARVGCDFDDFDGSGGRVGSADGRAQRLEPQHGPARPLSVRALRAGAGEDPVRSRRDRAAPGGLRRGRCRAPRASLLDEREQVGVDRVRLRGDHAVRITLVRLQLGVFQKLR